MRLLSSEGEAGSDRDNRPSHGLPVRGLSESDSPNMQFENEYLDGINMSFSLFLYNDHLLCIKGGSKEMKVSAIFEGSLQLEKGSSWLW